MSDAMWAGIAPGRSAWVMTLADLALLLVGFFTLLQANQSLDRARLMAGMRSGFGIAEPATPPGPAPMTVANARVDGFTVGGASADVSAVSAWVRDAARDRRTRLTLTGSTGPGRDVDPATGSAAILAADRARYVAAALVRSGAADPSRIDLNIEPGRRRAVTLSVGFAGVSD